jgi:hypothetical protein
LEVGRLIEGFEAFDHVAIDIEQHEAAVEAAGVEQDASDAVGDVGFVRTRGRGRAR